MLSFINVSLKLAEHQILDNVTWKIQSKERIALVGRNGAGKSTLLNLLRGIIVADKGQVQQDSGLSIAGLTQDVPVTEDQTVYHFLVSNLKETGDVLAGYRRACMQQEAEQIAALEQRIDALHAWHILPRVEAMAERLGLGSAIDARLNSLSGGMRRRALLAAALIAEPDLLLLDEPTNHLDMPTIEWLESYLHNYPGSVLFVTHDRKFLASVANRIVEIDRGQLHSYSCNYETYLDRRESRLLAEQRQDNLFDKRLQAEEAWIRQGVQARRTRNEGRVLRLKAMREEYRRRRESLGKVKTLTQGSTYSGKTVLETCDLTYTINEKTLLKNFSHVLTRGDKVGIIGPNGCGKTTLVKLLMGELQATSGTIHRGTNLELAYFDQLRQELNEKETVMAVVADGAEHVVLNGKAKHVASYLQDFLFTPERFHQKVHSLSGGERNRLLLAKLLAKPVNLLIMDEPTNDLDLETLELLESVLIDYPGTLILISHDRDFLDQVVSSVLVYEGVGHFNEFTGSYSDYHAYQQQHANITRKSKTATVITNKPTVKAHSLNSQEQQELKKLPNSIEKLEQQIQGVHSIMSQAEFYKKSPEEIVKINTQLSSLYSELSALYARWEVLEDKK
jgi:ABC transport system ATP-binding/permease protein